MTKDQEKPKVSYYDWMVAHDILEQLRPLWEQGGFYIRESDGKLASDPKLAIESPWRHVLIAWNFDCGTWHRIIFDYLSRKLPPGEKFVPSKCFECFKVVVRPKTLVQLFALEKLMHQLQRPSKCGIELRPSVHGLYGGYFYNTGLKEGLERWREVREAVSADPHMGPDIAVILKRGCTEFEFECGPSDEWQITDIQRRLEMLVDKYLAKDDVVRHQPEQVVWHIHRKWIEHAYAHGDPTYKELTDGKPLYPPYVTYHHLAEQAETVEEPQEPSGPRGKKGKGPSAKTEVKK
jgi:hypothetical protein